MTHDVFICHSSKDRTIANAICSTLEQNHIRCWIAPRDVIPGSEYAQSIIEAIGTSRLTVLVFSDNSNHSPHIHREIERSVSHGIPILPFRLEDVVPSPALEYFISDAHWLDAMTPPLEQHLDHLVGTVQLLLDREPAKDTSTHPPVAPDQGELASTPATASARRKWLWAGLGAAALVGAIIAGLLVSGSGSEPGGTSSQTTKPFTDEFGGTVDPKWTWVNEDSGAWTVSKDRGLQIDVQQTPPFHNVLLREHKAKSYSIRTHLRFDPSAPAQFAGLVITSKDLDNRLQFGWSSKALSLQYFKDGQLSDGAEIMKDQFSQGEWRESDLEIEVKDGYFTAWLTSDVNPKFEVDTGRLDPALTRVGLIAFKTTDAGDEAARFDRFVLE